MSTPRLTLAPEYTYRREWFGGLLFDHGSKQTRFYNHAAALTIESLLSPSAAEVDGEFLEQLRLERIAIPCDEARPPARAFFRDVCEFEPDRFHAPLVAELEITLACKRRCSYCACDARPDVPVNRELPRATYQRILDKLAHAGVLYLRLTGGDPLTRDDCLDILADADRLPFGLLLASDLTRFDASIARRLARLRNLIALQTTLDGPTASIADELRGHGNYKRVTTALDMLSRHGVPLIVVTIVSKRNVGYLYETARLLSHWPVAWCVAPLRAVGRGRDVAALVPGERELELAREQFARAVAEQLVRPADPAWPDRPAALPEQRVGLPSLVRAPDRVLRIDPRGRCYTSMHCRDAISDEVYVGNIVSDDVLAVWNHAPLLDALRREPISACGAGAWSDRA